MIVEIVTAIVGVVAGNVTAFMFFPQMRKAKQLENEAKQSDEWRKLYEEEKTSAAEYKKEAQEKIEGLYEEIFHIRDCKAEMSKHIAEMEVELTKLRLTKCEIVNCPSRKPPTGY